MPVVPISSTLGGDDMHDQAVTLFNRHNGKWYPTVIHGVTVVELTVTSTTETAGRTNGDTVELSIKTTVAKAIETTVGLKPYIPPKAYAVCTDPGKCVTFKPEQDFVYIGEWPVVEPIPDDDFESGFYHAINEEHDGVYMITSVSWLGLIPHFEIGGR